MLSLPQEEAEAFAKAILDAKRTVRLCPVCQNLTDQDVCDICSDPERDHAKICVVSGIDFAMERKSTWGIIFLPFGISSVFFIPKDVTHGRRIPLRTSIFAWYVVDS